MNNSESNPQKKASKLTIVAYVFTGLLFLFFSFALVPKMIGDISEIGISVFYSGTWEELVMYWTYIVFLIGFASCWKCKQTGGIIILISSIVQMGPFLIIDGNLGSLIFGLPLLTAGILLIASSKKV